MFATCLLPQTIPVADFHFFLYAHRAHSYCLVPKKGLASKGIGAFLISLHTCRRLPGRQSREALWENHYVMNSYNLSFVVLIFFVVLTLKFTRRKRGFKATTMDFLILVIALAAPYIAGAYTEYKEVGSIAAKTIVLFFSYEVLMGELRNKTNRLTFAMVCSMILITARGVLGA